MFGPGSLHQSMSQLDKAETEEAFESAVCGLRSYPQNFRVAYEKKIMNKKIHIIIHQPKIL